MSLHVIRMLQLAHCKRGPEQCERCRAFAIARPCLLDIDLPDAGRAQHRVLEVTIDGEKVWREFEVVRSFEDEPEARRYAEEHGIQDVDLGGS